MVAQRFSFGTAKKTASKKPAVKRAAAKPGMRPGATPSQLRLADEMLDRIERRNNALLADADRLLKLVS